MASAAAGGLDHLLVDLDVALVLVEFEPILGKAFGDGQWLHSARTPASPSLIRCRIFTGDFLNAANATVAEVLARLVVQVEGAVQHVADAVRRSPCTCAGPRGTTVPWRRSSCPCRRTRRTAARGSRPGRPSRCPSRSGPRRCRRRRPPRTRRPDPYRARSDPVLRVRPAASPTTTIPSMSISPTMSMPPSATRWQPYSVISPPSR